MHDCLLLQDIFSLVCIQLALGTGYPKRDLAALAQSCRALSETALEQLWYDMDDLRILIRCMPEDLWRNQGSPTVDKGAPIVFQRPIVPTDWPRFQVNAQKIRVFTARTSNGGLDLDIPYYQMLAVASCNRPLLPNLKNLRWLGDYEYAFPFLHLLLNPNLKKFEFFGGESPFAELALTAMATLPTTCPDITDFAIESRSLTKVTTGLAILYAMICGFDKLQRASLSNVNVDIYRHLAAMPSLKSLKLKPDLQSPIPPLETTDSPPFPALESFDITSTVSNCKHAVSKITSGGNLTTLVICFGENGENGARDDWGFLTREIRTTWKHCRLTSIRIGAIGTSDIIYTLDPPLRLEDIESLLSFPSLTELELAPVSGFDLDDASFKRMAQAWPSLTSFSLGEFWVEHRPRATLSCLEAFAQYCPNLQSLTLAVDACIPCRTGPRKVFGESLQYLELGKSPVEDVVMAATYLSDVFPRVTIRTGYEKAWEEVDKFHKAFVYVRDQE
ncbi:hypothetical protein FPV67DRAFT_1527822, partial [Lyophyllum atratum]